MSLGDFSKEAMRTITAGSLIAADIDQTLLVKGTEREKQQFLEGVAPELLHAAALGVNLAFLTANSMHELSSRFLQWLLAQIGHTGHWAVLDRFHFFSNSAGVYAHISLADKTLKDLSLRPDSSGALQKVLRAITVYRLREEVIDSASLHRCAVY